MCYLVVYLQSIRPAIYSVFENLDLHKNIVAQNSALYVAASQFSQKRS